MKIIESSPTRLTYLVKIIESSPTSDTKKFENTNCMLKIFELILCFNKQNQRGEGLKILTPSQMLSGLPNTLDKLKAGNNSEKFKNEIRQLLYSL